MSRIVDVVNMKIWKCVGLLSHPTGDHNSLMSETLYHKILIFDDFLLPSLIIPSAAKIDSHNNDVNINNDR